MVLPGSCLFSDNGSNDLGHDDATNRPKDLGFDKEGDYEKKISTLILNAPNIAKCTV